MYNTVIYFALLSLGIATAAPHVSKIVGGDEATLEDIPYVLELEGLQLGVRWALKCGAVLVAPSVALTAGHCVYQTPLDEVRLRANSTLMGLGYLRNVSEIIVHEKFVILDGYADYDIALLRVDEPFEISERTKPITVAPKEPSDGDVAIVSGWGTKAEGSGTPSNVLLKTDIPIVGRKTCISVYDPLAVVSDRMICAGRDEGGHDACLGDSGGPLAVNGTLVGIVSWGYGCAVAGWPGVYTNAAYFADWIQDKLNSS